MKPKFIFKTLNSQEFGQRFADTEACLQFLAEEKWKDGFVCRKCGHTNYCSGKSPWSRRCTRCKKEESATAHTVFHRCKVDLPEAFRMLYMVCNEPGVSSYELSERLEIRQMTCWRLKKKVTECLANGSPFSLLEDKH